MKQGNALPPALTKPPARPKDPRSTTPATRLVVRDHFIPRIGIIVLLVVWAQGGTQAPNRYG